MIVRNSFNLELFRRLGDLGLLGITAPTEYGGSGMDTRSVVIAHEELSYSDPGLCLAYLAHSVLCVNNLSVNGSNDQKKAYLPLLCKGEWVGAMAMSEPHMGTDLLGMKTKARRDKEGFIINGEKMWITNGTIDESKTPCDFLWLYAMNEESLKDNKTISTFIVLKDHKGFSVGQKIKDKTGMRASNTAELVFNNCEIPQTCLVGELGDSWNHMMKNLEIERLALAAMSLGIARRCLEVMIQYSQERTSFSKHLFQFGQIQKYIGESYAQYQAARSYVYNVATGLDTHQLKNSRLDSDGAKLFCAQIGKNIADSSIQVLGGYGYVGEYVVERLWRDAKLLEIGGGTLEAHQKNITFDLCKNKKTLD